MWPSVRPSTSDEDEVQSHDNISKSGILIVTEGAVSMATSGESRNCAFTRNMRKIPSLHTQVRRLSSGLEHRSHLNEMTAPNGITSVFFNEVTLPPRSISKTSIAAS
ncbi:hypothetical protein OGAPHI_000500 [Ogataea philodendri]|uniref:Uncharacterized protein n=1 Tax=Ogataea philodendri TaxID=1378263 RepID=A0A9P8PHB9_9ASCO|nr:uncharacterized protein OGAPHI_000500 [Ogataea philodendri]KAH3671277.1 hypothetical protein OGAPHI_000500 [Ogataea philodendri]